METANMNNSTGINVAARRSLPLSTEVATRRINPRDASSGISLNIKETLTVRAVTRNTNCLAVSGGLWDGEVILFSRKGAKRSFFKAVCYTENAVFNQR